MAGSGQRLLNVEPTTVHQRTPVIMGSSREVERVLRCLEPEQAARKVS
jgi:fructose-1,6-bisphosphatase